MMHHDGSLMIHLVGSLDRGILQNISVGEIGMSIGGLASWLSSSSSLRRLNFPSLIFTLP